MLLQCNLVLCVHFQFVLLNPSQQTCDYTSVQMGKAYENVSDMTSSNSKKLKGTKEDYENVVQAQVLNGVDQLSDDDTEDEISDNTSGVDSDASSVNYSVIVFNK